MQADGQCLQRVRARAGHAAGALQPQPAGRRKWSSCTGCRTPACSIAARAGRRSCRRSRPTAAACARSSPTCSATPSRRWPASQGGRITIAHALADWPPGCAQAADHRQRQWAGLPRGYPAAGPSSPTSPARRAARAWAWRSCKRIVEEHGGQDRGREPRRGRCAGARAAAGWRRTGARSCGGSGHECQPDPGGGRRGRHPPAAAGNPERGRLRGRGRRRRRARRARARARQQPDLVLLDIWMPDTDGITLLREWSTIARRATARW